MNLDEDHLIIFGIVGIMMGILMIVALIVVLKPHSQAEPAPAVGLQVANKPTDGQPSEQPSSSVEETNPPITKSSEPTTLALSVSDNIGMALSRAAADNESQQQGAGEIDGAGSTSTSGNGGISGGGGGGGGSGGGAPKDSDHDGLTDSAETNTYGTNPHKGDTDDDGLADGAEVAKGTNPLFADTDGDGILDGTDQCPLARETFNGVNDSDGCPDAAPSPDISINNVPSSEGDSGTTSFDFTITRSGDTSGPSSVDFATADGTASSPSDYSSNAGTLAFAGGETTKKVSVMIAGDSTVESDETFFVNLSNCHSCNINDPQGLGTIVNDDAPPPPPEPTLSISDVSLAEANSGTKSFDFTITRSGDTSRSLSIDFATADGTASSPSDYSSNTGTLSFAADETSKTITILVNGDTAVEPNETFNVNLSNCVNCTIGDSQGVGTIQNDDVPPPPPEPTVSVGDVWQAEGNSGTTSFDFTITRSGDTSGSSSVDFATADGYSASSSDYTSKSGTVNFAAGEATKTVTVDVNGDTDVEPNETFLLNLSNCVGCNITDSQGVGTILNDDTAPPPTVSMTDVSLAEGNSGSKNFIFKVTRNGDTAGASSIDFATADGTATLADSDYISNSGTISFGPGELTKTITIQVNGDSAVEPNETFNVNLSNCTNCSISDGQGVGTIVNDDLPPPPPEPSLSIRDVSLAEGDLRVTSFDFTITRSGDTSGASSVDFATADGTASSPSDYSSNAGTLSFAAGETTKTVTILVNGDTAVEPNETFSVNLSNCVNCSISDGQGAGSIVNDDVPPPPPEPTLSISDVSLAEGDLRVTSFDFTITRSGDTSGASSVDFATADGTATLADSDYISNSGTISFAPGELTKTVTILVNGDIVLETDETFSVNLSNCIGCSIRDGQGLGTILNDDLLPPPPLNTRM